MNTIQVNASRSYPVYIGSGILESLGSMLHRHTKAQKAAIVCDRNVWKLYGCRVQDRLTNDGFQVASFVFSPGEKSKNSDTFLQILNFLAENSFTRSDCLIALGGGVVGDLGGFSAACYQRGIPYVQVPTTLLAAVDSSVGGKTGIDLASGKNLAGAFYQPQFVLCDTDTLRTLPVEVFREGCSEIIKYGILYDPSLFAHLEDKGLSFDREWVISRCVVHKAKAVCQDEFDRGQRRLLNLGHTIGHAIEKESEYVISHGQAVSIGIAVVTRAAASQGICHEESCRRILNLLTRFGLPIQTDFSVFALQRHAMMDKKADAGFVHCILPQSIGSCTIKPMDYLPLLQFIKAGL